MKIVNRRPICNNNPSSAPHINGKYFWLCWRCTGVVIGAFIITVFTFIIDCSWHITPILFLLALPACVDYFITRKKIIRESNFRRCASGILLGIPLGITLLHLLK